MDYSQGAVALCYPKQITSHASASNWHQCYKTWKSNLCHAISFHLNLLNRLPIK